MCNFIHLSIIHKQSNRKYYVNKYFTKTITANFKKTYKNERESCKTTQLKLQQHALELVNSSGSLNILKK